MDCLPCEMIEHIYSFLPYKDRLRATEVCSRWKAIFESRVINETLLTVTPTFFYRDDKEKDGFPELVQYMKNSTRIYRNLKLDEIVFENIEPIDKVQLSIMLANLSLNVVHLTLEKCRLPFDKLFMIILLLRQIKTISMNNCHVYNDWTPAPEFRPTIENLESVSIFNLNAHDFCLITEFLMNGNSANISINARQNLMEYVANITEIYAHRIKQMALTFCEMRPIRRIFDCGGLKLEYLSLHRIPTIDLHHTTFHETIATQTNLQELNIGMKITLRTLAEISRNFAALKRLQVSISDDDTEEAMPFIWPKLKVLDLTYSGDICTVLHGMEFKSELDELLIQTEKLTSTSLELIYKKCDKIKRLTLTTLSLLRCEKVLGSIAIWLPCLTEIELECSSRTTFIPFFRSIHSLMYLTSLMFVHCDFITNATFEHINLPHLNKLVITQNVKISKPGFSTLCSNCPEIKSLTLQSCAGVDDEAVKAIVALLPDLEVLDFSRSSRITLNSIRYIFEGCRFLKGLHIENCRRLIIEWRRSPVYIYNFKKLKSYYEAYPEFFNSHLPAPPAAEFDINYCCFYDRIEDEYDAEHPGIHIYREALRDLEPLCPISESSDESVVVISDDE